MKAEKWITENAPELPGKPLEVTHINPAYVEELEGYLESLKDFTVVHSNILAGRIALTKAQAIHIAGLPANIEAFAKEMAEHIVKTWQASEFNECLYCKAQMTHHAQIEPTIEWRDTTVHKPDCPVPRAEQYLKGLKK